MNRIDTGSKNENETLTDTTENIVHSAKCSIVEELPEKLDAFETFRSVAHLPYPVFFDSSLSHSELANASYIAVDPFDARIFSDADPQALKILDELQHRYQTETIAGLPRFQGGLVHLLSYELNRCFEEIPPTKNDFEIPTLFYGIYDTVLVFDHETGRNWIVSHGFPETEPGKREQRAKSRIKQLRECINQRNDLQPFNEAYASHSNALSEDKIQGIQQSDISNRIFSNFTRDQYISAVQKCIDYIYAGDIFQVNLSQRLLSRQVEPSLEVYKRLRRQNPATFSAYLDLGEVQFLSSSPERLLRIDTDGSVETRPIKGTRQRSCYPEANLFSAEGLIASEKDRAENVMIVDLLRNDLSKFCHDDSIHVSKLCGIENYEFVQHLVSVVRGEMRPDVTFSQIVESVFPGGSITGAPKVRAMEIIAEVEKVARGAYCGSLGYQGFDRALDQNILIRTITCAGGWYQIPVGGGIVSQSDPVSEYEETIHKAHGMLRSII